MAEINSFTGLRTIEVIDECMRPENNLGDLRSPATALTNLGVNATAAELNLSDNAIASISWAVAAGASNVCVMTGTIKDAAGATIAAVRKLLVYLSTSATGVGVSATSYSTGAAITTGTSIIAETANKVFEILTHTDGTFAISITASGKPATEYGVAVVPMTGALNVSAASAALWGA